MPFNFTIVQQKVTPVVQSVTALVIGIAGMLLVKALSLHGSHVYFAAFIALVFFTIFNTIASLGNSSFFRYTVPSYYLYAGMVVILLLCARFLSGISIWNLWEYRMMLFSLTIFYFMVSVLVRAIRAIYELGEKGY